MTSQFLIPIVATVVFYAVYHLVKMVQRDNTHPFRDLPGPKGGNFLIGHYRKLFQNHSVTDKWGEEFGANYQLRGLFNRRELYTTDTKALTHILVNDDIYQKGHVSHKIVTNLLGNGLLSVETTEHKRQRKIVNPAFGVPQIRGLTEIFNRKSVQLRDIWSREIGDSGSSRIDIFGWLRKMTLDVIGEAGFNYQFNALDPNGEINELEEALTRLMHSPQSHRQSVIRLLQAEIPILSFLPTPGAKIMDEARGKMMEIARQLLVNSQADIKAGGISATKRDLLSLLVQSNATRGIQEDQRLNDTDVIAQIPTFFVAGHENVSIATALALHALSLYPLVQSKLREELLSISTDDPTMDELNSFPYLENVVREVMRVYSPVAFTRREAMEDDVLPLSKPYLDRNGKSYDSISVPKGTLIQIPISAVHRDKEIWGADADVFRPERWDATSEAVSAIPSVWGNLLTFLAGPHNCIGFRFSIVEIKSLLFTLLRTFEFAPALPEDMIEIRPTPVLRPTLRTEPKGGNQLPLIVRPYLTT
ncbi:cytochrome P450 [Mycena albidolilacea]|uniref:Cytochrome P450 n=1 Tax=Mycena albidolilacea TaxID=1033008 RepID=A0AAD7AGH3_9AGAR|nr:cytochrome P450 [Mycena albidolilacea]